MSESIADAVRSRRSSLSFHTWLLEDEHSLSAQLRDLESFPFNPIEGDMPSLETVSSERKNVQDEGIEVEHGVHEKERVLATEGHDLGAAEGLNNSHDAPLPEAEHVQVLKIHGVSTLHCMWPQIPIEEPAGEPLIRFGPRAGPCTDLEQQPYLNDPNYMDVDLACFKMLAKDLPTLIGTIGRPTNRKVKIKDLEEFACWIHVISYPIVVKVYGRSNQLERNAFKDEVFRCLRSRFDMTLSPNYDSMTLFNNQVNNAVSALSQSLVSLGAKICRVQFFGMKWQLSEAEPIIDSFVERYHSDMDLVPLERNIFDYGVAFPEERMILYKFSEDQVAAKFFVEGRVHEMCHV